MAGIVWPVDVVAGAPSYTGRMLRNASVSPQVGGATSARPLGGFSGVRPGTVNPCSATSTTWTVTPCAGTLDGEAAAIAGVYNYAFNANQTGSVTAAAGSARIDRLDVQLSDPAEGDGTSTPGIAIVRTDGVAGSGVPNTAPARSHLLCYINVPASGGGSPTITYNAPYTAAAGALQPVSSSTAYPASPYVGQAVYDTTLLCQLIWNGTIWEPTPHTLAVNRQCTAVNLIVNPTSYADIANSGVATADTTALLSSFVKRVAGTKLVVSVFGTAAYTSGAAQDFWLGINIGGTDYDVAKTSFPAATIREGFAGTVQITGIAAGTLAVKPRMKSAGASQIQLNTDDALSYSITETL